VELRHSNAACYGVIRVVQVNQDGLKLNGTCQFLIYIEDVNVLGESVRGIKENREALLVASNEMDCK